MNPPIASSNVMTTVTLANLSKTLVKNYAESWRQLPNAKEIDRWKAFSMLHQETLAALNLFATLTTGHVIEIGPYKGASTVAVATGLARAGPIHCVEVGGSYKTHPQLPSSDIVGDLHENLEREGVAGGVEIIVGWSGQEHVQRYFKDHVPARSVGLLVIDADGAVGRDFWLFEPYLMNGCLVVFDDYDSPGSKGLPVKRFVDRGVRRRMLEDLGVLPWATWFGRYRRAPSWLQRLWKPRDMLGRCGGATVRRRLSVWRKSRRNCAPVDH